MNVQEKKRKKNLAYRYTAGAYICMISMVVVFTITIIGRVYFDVPMWIGKLGGIFALILLLSGLVFAALGEAYIFMRKSYIKDIQDYRHRVMFLKVIDLIKANRFDEAVDLYNAYKANSDIKIFLYSYIVIARLYSSDPIQRELGERRLKELMQKWNPDKITF